MSDSKPAIFDHYPKLHGVLPHVSLIDCPTPVQHLEKLSGALDTEVWIKRDDLSSMVYGGNKPRKLEFILGGAKVKGQKTLVTMGGIGTNHGLATVIHGRNQGMNTVLELFPQPVTPTVLKNLKMFHAHGAKLNLCKDMYRAWLRFRLWERLSNPTACYIPAGGSNPLGAVGYVSAGLELADQIRQGLMPEPKVIFVAAGTTGTHAGLVLGLRLAGIDIRVQGVAVVPPPVTTPRTSLSLARKSLALLRKADPAVPELELSLADVPMDMDRLGQGYGYPTPEGDEAMGLMEDYEGIGLEPTYTAKTLASLVAFARAYPGQGPLMYWNTYNSVDLAEQAARVDPATLPAEFHRFFEKTDLAAKWPEIFVKPY